MALREDPSGTAAQGENLGGLSSEEIERRARAHLDGVAEEIREAGHSLRARLRPVALIRRYPKAAGIVGGAVILLLLRFLRGRRGAVVVQGSEPEPLARTFRRSLLSSVAKTAGRALPGVVLWGLARRGHGRGRRGSPVQ